ncbi:MAG: GAF domain-containing protein [Lachnospiraceae bacterium]|nr:GAF domain-containing protein [Lachnospiraceae bacterium]
MTDYDLMISQLRAFGESESHFMPFLANASALLWQTLDRINWAGFYLIQGTDLLLGPFQGKPACIRIGSGKGVCGSALSQDAPLVVPDVHLFPGHIACDSASASEIVIPLHFDGQKVGVLDIDSPEKARFSETDKEKLLEFVSVIEELGDFRPWFLSQEDR